MLLSEAVHTVRSMVLGSFVEDVTVLDGAYDPLTDNTISLRYPRRNIAPGALLSCGLNTWLVLEVSADGNSAVIAAGADGGPKVAMPDGSLINVRPSFTNWSIVREINSEIAAMSSPMSGLADPYMFQSSGIAWADGMYVIDPDDLPAGRSVVRLLKAEYRVGHTDAWQSFSDCEYQHSAGVIRVFSDPNIATEYNFTLGLSFGQPTTLETDLATLGVTDDLVDIVTYGAAASMAMSWLSRSAQPSAQGDSRRPYEVSGGVRTAVPQMFREQQRLRLADEYARFLKKYPVQMANTSGPSTWLSGWAR